MRDPDPEKCGLPAAKVEEAIASSPLTQGEVIRRSAVLMLMTGASRVFGFFATVAIARHFSAAEFGAINLAQQLGFQGLIVATCGLDLYAVRNAVKLGTGLGSVASTVILLRLVLSVLVYGLVLAAAATFPPLRPVMPLIALFGLMFFTEAISVRWVSQATQRAHVLGLSHLCTKVLYVGLVYLAISESVDIWAIPVAFVSAEFVVAVGLWLWMRSRVERLHPPMAPMAALRFLRKAAPIGGARILRVVAMGSDLILLGLLLTLEETGWYSGAYKLYLVGVGMIGMYFVILFPNLVRRATQGPRALRHELRVSLVRTVVPSVAVLFVGGWFAPDLLVGLFNPSFGAAGTSFRLLLGSLLIVLISGHLRHGLVAVAQQRQDMANVFLAATTHILAKIILIPLVGITGCAVGTVLGEAVLVFLSWKTLSHFLRTEPEPEPAGAEEALAADLPGEVAE